MHFPSDMNFQYFFFNTYPGYFLQALPFALLAGAIYLLYRVKRKREPVKGELIWKTLFVCYMTGLICLVIGLDIMIAFWYAVVYHGNNFDRIHMFVWTYDFIPDFFNHINDEVIGNVLMFLPFGVLYPLSHRGASFVKTLAAGTVCSSVIELLQPVFGRAFDVNDVILNTLGILASAAVCFAVKALVRKRKKPR